ncbi:MAG TPA: lysophospholipid acyltransferase family protein [Hydrogenophaga sp.]|uniref:lysophospholipid acyltransferase family protein n=1 Tax=Hydrogenophaga sp. TaxID=1904254 RepID=UPI002D0F4D4B|nr:lysophospholipid acyltransferase family protein [Hydrogenophaga sp.]HMN93586.1 lysophospholipid acyltransferase family protein [Hydrogenophaga sp.]HMP09095.1 lysophospholipid acyltransferase family protein [Hydrogenophaga sp.]
MKKLRATWRAWRAIVHVLRGLWIIRREFGRMNDAQKRLLVREWSRRMLAILGVSLEVRGRVHGSGPLLVVANHISWLDIIVMNACQPARFVSKADAGHWPVLGALIRGAGTLFIERENRRDAMRVVHLMAERLVDRDIVAVFPEGTTGDGRQVLPFHANLLQAAISTGAPVLPVALGYRDPVDRTISDAPLFIGDTTLLSSIWSTLCADGVLAVVHQGEPEEAHGRDRRAWARDLQDMVGRLAAEI